MLRHPILFMGIRSQRPDARLPFVLLLLLAITACTHHEFVHRAMKWSPQGSGVALSFVCAPNQRVIVESPELLSSLQKSGRTQVDVEFVVSGPLFGDAGAKTIDPFGPLCN